MKVSYLTRYNNKHLYDSGEALSYISDRRRVVGWAKERGHTLISKPTEEADAAVFGVLSDLRQLEKFSSQLKVLDMVDGYLALNENPFIDVLRGFRRQDRWFQSVKFSQRLEYACSRADRVVVGSPEQARLVHKHNKRVHVILDNQLEFGSPRSIKQPETREKKTLIWEGLSSTLFHLFEFAEIIDEYLEKTDSRLIIISNETIVLNKFYRKPLRTKEAIDRKFPRSKVRIQFHPWNVQTLLDKSREADVAIIPLNLGDNIALYKPENKLLIMLSLGLPALVSPIHSYSRTLNLLGLGSFLVQENDWSFKLEELSYLQRENIDHHRVTNYLQNILNPEKLYREWDKVFDL